MLLKTNFELCISLIDNLSFKVLPLDQDPTDMSFLDHLETLRWHILRAGIAILVFMIAAFVSMDVIFREVILAPARVDFWTYVKLCEIGKFFNIQSLCIDKIDFTLQSRQMAGQFTMHITASFVIGLIAAFPYVFWEIWRFVAPGLLPKERRLVAGAVFFVSGLFAIGVLFGYFIIAPMSINFLANYKLDESIMNQFDITSYISTLCLMVLGAGLIFQLPVVVYLLSRLGFVTPNLMRQFRRHSIVIIFIVAAIITPSPDVLSQLLVALPLVLLYEISIFISAGVVRSKIVART